MSLSFDILINAAILAVALFLMVRFGFGYRFMAHAQGHAQTLTHKGPAGDPSPSREDIDPVCGMTVDRSSAISSAVDGRSYYFCSEGCRERFEASPAFYTGATVAAPPQVRRHGCCG
jgi:YHS domain-containing protein